MVSNALSKLDLVFKRLRSPFDRGNIRSSLAAMAEKTTAVTIHLEIPLKEKLEKLAAEEDRSMAKTIVRLIKDRLKTTTDAQIN